MVRTICLVLLGLFLFSVAPLNADAPPRAEPPPDPGTVEITLGQSVVPLYGPWKFTVGDSPIDAKTGKPLWAQPDFDDSKWETADLAPGTNATDHGPGNIPGWTDRGHAGYWGWAWYRLRLKISAKPGAQMGARMAIDGPFSADDAWQFFDAWQVFVRGQLIGSFGNFDSRGNVQRIYDPRPLMFPLLPVQNSEYGTVTETLAFRVWMGPGRLGSPNVGGLHYPPMLVAGSAVAAQSRLDWQKALTRRVDEAAFIALFLLLAVLSASLICLIAPTGSTCGWRPPCSSPRRGTFWATSAPPQHGSTAVSWT